MEATDRYVHRALERMKEPALPISEGIAEDIRGDTHIGRSRRSERHRGGTTEEDWAIVTALSLARLHPRPSRVD